MKQQIHALFDFYGFEWFHETNKFGADNLDVVLHFIKVLTGPLRKKEQQILRLKSYIVQQIQRGITGPEEIALYQGIRDYIKSEPGSPDRAKALKYLLLLEFLTLNIK